MTNVVYKPIILLKNTIKYIIYLYFTFYLNIRDVRKVIDEKEKLSITIRDATVRMTGVIDNRSTGNRCEAVTVPTTNWFAFRIISLIN